MYDLAAHLWLGKHICQPGTDQTVRTRRDEVIGILRAHHLHRVDGVGVACSRQRRLEHGKVLCACVPEEDLAGVRPAENQGRVEGGESHGEDVGLGRASQTRPDWRGTWAGQVWEGHSQASGRRIQVFRGGAGSKQPQSHLDRLAPPGSCCRTPPRVPGTKRGNEYSDSAQ